MVQCSWTGGSRSDTLKCSIRNCKNILNVFFTIIRSSNKNFSEILLKKFFVGITKNAKKRSMTGGIRQSSVHRRKKLIKKQPPPNEFGTQKEGNFGITINLPIS